MAVPAAASADRHPTGSSPVVGHVYVNDNTAGTNTIGAFDRHADGTLTPQPGSPFVAGGAGTGTGLASQGAIQITPDGRFLIAVDAGSNQISVLRIHRDGSLSLVPGGVVSSGGTPARQHRGPRQPGVCGQLRDRRQQLHRLPARLLRPPYPIPGSTVALAANAAPADVLFNGTGTKLAGTEVGTSADRQLHRRLRRAADRRPRVAVPGPGPGPVRQRVPADQPRPAVRVQRAQRRRWHRNRLAFTDASNGTLTPVAGSPFADGQTAPCWVEITHDGQFLFTVNTGSGEISRYQIAPDGALTLLGSTPVSATGGVGAVDARLSPDGRFLYVDESRIGKVGAFAVNGGNLTELATSPTSLPAGATPAGIVAN